MLERPAEGARVPKPRSKARPSPAEVLEMAKKQGFNYLKATDCPDLETRHARGHPKDFNPSSGRSKTHTQERCLTCGYWSLWVPKEEA